MLFDIQILPYTLNCFKYRKTFVFILAGFFSEKLNIGKLQEEN